MSHRQAARGAAGTARWTITLALAVLAASGLPGLRSAAVSSSPASDDGRAPSTAAAAVRQATVVRPPAAPPPSAAPRRLREGGPGEADGVVPGGLTVFDDEYPAVARLDGALLRALRRAATDAAGDAVEFRVNSGWRSAKYQEQLLREAVAQYGSRAEAARWVATAQNSPHVAGDAVDIGPARAAAWLSRHGARYGLCQVYRNEPWHYELRPTAVAHGCPPMYADPTHDPRMRR